MSKERFNIDAHEASIDKALNGLGVKTSTNVDSELQMPHNADKMTMGLMQCYFKDQRTIKKLEDTLAMANEQLSKVHEECDELTVDNYELADRADDAYLELDELVSDFNSLEESDKDHLEAQDARIEELCTLLHTAYSDADTSEDFRMRERRELMESSARKSIQIDNLEAEIASLKATITNRNYTLGLVYEMKAKELAAKDIQIDDLQEELGYIENFNI